MGVISACLGCDIFHKLWIIDTEVCDLCHSQKNGYGDDELKARVSDDVVCEH